MTIEADDLIAAIEDPCCDAVELTRRALVLARSRAPEVDEAANTDSTVVTADAAHRRFIAALGRPTTLDLTETIRRELSAAIRQTIALDDTRKLGLEGLVAHKLALAIEAVLGCRFYDHLAAAGPRRVGPDELIALATPFRDRSDPFRVAYGADLSPAPSSLGRSSDSLESYARLPPPIPHGATLTWIPTWTVLDDLEPDWQVAAVLPGRFDELRLDIDDDGSRKTFFAVRPRDPTARTQAALELVQRADSKRAQLVVLPELCLDVDGVDAVARWIEEQASEIRVAVCGSAHREIDGRRENVAVVACSRESQDDRRVEQPKLVPFVLRQDGENLHEDIYAAGRTIALLSGRRCSLLVLVCMDFIDHALSRLAADLRPTLVVVPACSATTGPFDSAARDLAARSQCHVIVVNQPAPGRGNPDAALIARPRREGRDVLESAAAEAQALPGMWWTSLAKGAWEPDT